MSGLRSTAAAAVEASARARLGLFTASDADVCGVSRSLLKYHCRTGRWSRLLPGVYVVAGLPDSVQRPLLAALLWAGPTAVLSHRAAAKMLGLDGVGPGPPEVWAQRGHSTGGVIVHRGEIVPGDVRRAGLLRVTCLRRTVIDLAAVLDDDRMELVVESALRKDRGLEFDQAAGTSGRARLRRVLARRPPGAPATESELETRYLQVVRTAGLPPPVRQHRVVDERGQCVGRLDVCWPEVGLWVELDGRATHDQPGALLSDRHRQNQLADRLQWLPLRFTWDDVVTRPRQTAHFTEQAYLRRSAA
jgi:hypothetical protein